MLAKMARPKISLPVVVRPCEQLLEALIRRDSDHVRLSFDQVEVRSPELGRRVVILRSRIKDLREDFRRDAERAHRCFNVTTIAVTAVVLLAGGVAVYLGAKDALLTASATAFAALAALAAAGAQAFGWHRRYHAMFHAQWAMTALATDIDQIVHEISIGLPDSGELDEDDRKKLDENMSRWRQQFIAVLTSFGDQYGSALTALEWTKSK